MTKKNKPIIVDYSSDLLPGSPLAVTLILSDATWDSLTKSIDDIRLFGGQDILPLNLRIERFIEDQTAAHFYAIDDTGDLEGEIAF